MAYSWFSYSNWAEKQLDNICFPETPDVSSLRTEFLMKVELISYSFVCHCSYRCRTTQLANKKLTWRVVLCFIFRRMCPQATPTRALQKTTENSLHCRNKNDMREKCQSVRMTIHGRMYKDVYRIKVVYRPYILSSRNCVPIRDTIVYDLYIFLVYASMLSSICSSGPISSLY